MDRHRYTVLQVLPELESGGVERGTCELAAELVRRGHRSLVLSGGGRLVQQVEDQGTKHITWPVGRKSPGTLRFVSRLRGLLSDEQVDLLHVRSRVPAWIAWLAWRGMSPQTRPRLVTTCHGLYSVNAYSAVMTKGERVIAISQTVRDYLHENYPRLDPGRIRLVYRGVDPEDFPFGFTPSDAWTKRWHEEWPELAGRKIVTLPGRLTRYKGHMGFIELMRRLKQQRPDAIGLIVGGVDPRRTGYYDALVRRIQECRLDNIIFTGARSDIREIYAASDLVVSMSIEPPEAFGRTTLEALSLGVPVVGYDQSGVGEILRELFPLGAVPFGDLDQMTANVVKMLDRSPTIQPNGTFTLQQMFDRTIGVYDELMAERCLARAA